jgi:hypothetical protein
MTPREEAQRSRATLNYNCAIPVLLHCRTQETQGHRGTRGGIKRDTRDQRDRREQGGIQETPEGPEDTRGMQEAPGRSEGEHGGIGAGRKAIRIQHIRAFILHTRYGDTYQHI